MAKEQSIARAVFEAEDPPPPTAEDQDPVAGPCPITPLGQRQGVYYFITKSGELRSAGAREIGAGSGLQSLFDGEVGWLLENFPSTGRNGKPDGGFNALDAGAWLIRACAAAGLFDADSPVRGPGVWRSPSGGLIVHCGNLLIVDGDRRPAREKIGEAIYPAYPPIAKPARQPATVSAAQRLLAGLSLWRYRTPAGAELVLGALGAALYGAAHEFRLHQFITGPFGSGKSTHAAYAAAVLGAGAHPITDDVTEPGLRQAFNGEARVVLYDEAEGDEGPEQMAAIIGILRRMSTGDGATALRGTPGGKHQKFTVNGSAMLYAIRATHLKPADRSRFLMIDLDELISTQEHVDDQTVVKRAIAEAAKLSPEIRARAFDRWPFFQACFATYRAAFLSAGASARGADAIATVLAGRDMLLAEEMPDSDTLAEVTVQFADLVAAYARNEEEGEGQQCLNHLYSAPADLWRSGERLLVSEVIIRARNKEWNEAQNASYARMLGKIGLRLHVDDQGAEVLLIANDHQGLEKLFSDSAWKNRGWIAALQLPRMGKPWTGNPVRFAGVKVRCTALPASWLPSFDQVDEDDGKPKDDGKGIPPIGGGG